MSWVAIERAEVAPVWKHLVLRLLVAGPATGIAFGLAFEWAFNVGAGGVAAEVAIINAYYLVVFAFAGLFSGAFSILFFWRRPDSGSSFRESVESSIRGSLLGCGLGLAVLLVRQGEYDPILILITDAVITGIVLAAVSQIGRRRRVASSHEPSPRALPWRGRRVIDVLVVVSAGVASAVVLYVMAVALPVELTSRDLAESYASLSTAHRAQLYVEYAVVIVTTILVALYMLRVIRFDEGDMPVTGALIPRVIVAILVTIGAAFAQVAWVDGSVVEAYFKYQVGYSGDAYAGLVLSFLFGGWLLLAACGVMAIVLTVRHGRQAR